MGAGKTTVGRLLADGLGVAASATPTATSRRPRAAPISDIFVDAGEAHFRALEREAVAAALADHDGVLALGGGAVLDPATRELLGRARRSSSSGSGSPTPSSGSGSAAARPLLLGNVRGQIKALLDERTPVYEAVATARRRHRRPHARGRRDGDRSALSEARREDAGMTRGHRAAGRPAPRRTTSWSATACSDRLPGAAGRRRAAGGGDPLRRARRAGRAGARRARRGVRRPGARGARRRGGQDVRGGRRLLGGARRGRVHPLRRGRDRRRRRDDRPRRLRRRDLAARRPGRARADHAARHGRRGGRRQDRHQHRRRQEPRRRLPRAGRRAVRPRPAGDPAAAPSWSAGWRGRQVRLHRRPRDPRAGRGRPGGRARPGSAVLRELVERAVRVKADVVAGDLQGDRRRDGPPRPRGAQLRPHAGARDRAGRALPVRHGEAVSIGMVFVAELARLAGRLDDETAERHRARARRWSGCRRRTRGRRSTTCSRR